MSKHKIVKAFDGIRQEEFFEVIKVTEMERLKICREEPIFSSSSAADIFGFCLKEKITATFEEPVSSFGYHKCPCCSEQKFDRVDLGIRTCLGCNAIFGTPSLESSYKHVLPEMDNDPAAPNARYFDFTCSGGTTGVTRRRHGWYNPETKLITQIG